MKLKSIIFLIPAFSAIYVLAMVALALVSAPLAAQDVTIGNPVTYSGLDDGQNRAPLKLNRSPKPDYPDALRGANTYGCAIAFSPSLRDAERAATTSGRTFPTTSAAGSYTHKEIGMACMKAFRDWEWIPALPTEDDPRRAWVVIIFNPASASKSKKNAAPRLLDVTPVFIPSSPGNTISPNDRVAYADVTVGTSGEIKGVKITSTSRAAMQNQDAIAEAVSHWKIAPALRNGVATEATINVPILLLRSPLSVSKRETHKRETPSGRITRLTPIKQADTVYPMGMEKTNERGRVTLEFTLDGKGRPQNPLVVLSTNKAFDAPALAAIRKYRFEKPDPAKPDSLGNICANPSDARWQYEVNFAPSRDFRRAVTGDEALLLHPAQLIIDEHRPIEFQREVNAGTHYPQQKPVAVIYETYPGTTTAGQNITRPVLAPESVQAVAPVYPYELLRKNITGSATVRMPCGSGLLHVYPDIISSTQEAFGLALAAAVRYYTVMPKFITGRPAASMLTATFDFDPGNPELRLTEKTKQLLADETQNPGKIIPEDKLDKRLQIQKSEPKSTSGLNINANLAGSTVIEFLVDETGRVYLPRIIKTDVPEAAYILMQMVSMRVYEPPMRNGQRVVARAREKVMLDAPRDSTAGKQQNTLNY